MQGCIFLLSAVEASRRQLETYQASQGTRPVLEEFIPLKQSSAELSDNTSNKSEKTNWMTTAQLWSQANDGSKCNAAKMSSSDETVQGFSITPKLSLDNKERNGGGFLPFSRERNFCTNPPELTLASVNKEIEEKKCLGPANGMSSSGKEHCTKAEKEKGMANEAGAQTTTQPQRKARRCWSPDLHRRFVNALQMLGGSQGNKNWGRSKTTLHSFNLKCSCFVLLTKHPPPKWTRSTRPYKTTASDTRTKLQHGMGPS